MHPVLDLQTDRSDTEADKAFKQGLIEACLGSFLTHDNWPQLTVVTDKDDMLRLLEDRQ